MFFVYINADHFRKYIICVSYASDSMHVLQYQSPDIKPSTNNFDSERLSEHGGIVDTKMFAQKQDGYRFLKTKFAFY